MAQSSSRPQAVSPVKRVTKAARSPGPPGSGPATPSRRQPPVSGTVAAAMSTCITSQPAGVSWCASELRPVIAPT